MLIKLYGCVKRFLCHHTLRLYTAEITATGGHNMLLVWHPGTGKSMLAKRFIGLLPDLSKSYMIDVNIISSITRTDNGIFEII
ncbi:MAG: ATP-binding protein [Wolbachia sp.]|nr:ATP-binding protein [Wolbachia sp.]